MQILAIWILDLFEFSSRISNQRYRKRLIIKNEKRKKFIRKEPIEPLHFLISAFLYLLLFISVAEPPLFWAAPAPDGRGPGADSGSGSDLLGLAPAPGKKGGFRRLRLHALKIFILSFQKVNY